MLRNTLRVCRKELGSFFASPVAYIFLGVFLLVSLFVVFWAESFFARNIADVRPLFEWMPVLLIFLVAALTMRMWSEERRTGTLEYLLTLPVRPGEYLLGKFLAALFMVLLALLLTLPLPFSVAAIGPLDWGPVWGGYLAALFLGAAYIAIGLFLSVRSDSQIVSLIGTVVICGVFYLLGSDLLTGFFGNDSAELLRLFGSGARFSSITRGVIDLRDLYYYLSLVGVFFVLTLYSLRCLRWDSQSQASGPRCRMIGMVALVLIVNLIAAHLWLQQIGSLRLDLTQGRIYSISPTTREYLARLQEPLLIRGYFSAKTHPLLAPLVPQLRDLISEYQLAGHGNVRSEFVDPQQHPDLEAEANEKYGIKPVPFKVADRYQAALVNSYFQVLIQYGDQYQVLDFRDLIEVKNSGESGVDVELNNPEYQLTRCIKRVLFGFQAGGDLFANLAHPLTLTGYLSDDSRLPDFLKNFRVDLQSVAGDMEKKSAGQFALKIIDPQGGDGHLVKELAEKYGFQPMQAGLYDSQRFYFYLTLDDGTQTVQIPLADDFTRPALERSIKDALKRFSAGYLKTVALALPAPPDSFLAQYGMAGSSKGFTVLKKDLEQNYNVTEFDLSSGVVPESADILVVVAPKDLDDKQLFAIDQFLMQGGTVLLAASPFDVNISRSSLSADKQQGKLLDWLEYNGLAMQQQLVLDPRSQPLPIPVSRTVGGIPLQEIQMVPYPYFLDVRDDGLNQQLPVTAGLTHLLYDWAAPIQVDDKANSDRKITWLLKSSEKAWTSDAQSLLPKVTADGEQGFDPARERAKQLLGVALEGQFSSYFAGQPSPLLEGAKKSAEQENAAEQKNSDQLLSVIEKSPEAARLILFSSADFVADQTLQLASAVSGNEDYGGLQLISNSLDWSLEDQGLLAIRGRGHYARTLIPLEHDGRVLVESFNYALALIGLGIVFVVYRVLLGRKRAVYRCLLERRAP